MPPPPPNQTSIKAFISGSSNSWKCGDSPLLGEQRIQKNSSDQGFESEVHDNIFEAGIFFHFKNQASALAYLNGQIMFRKKMLKQTSNLDKKVTSFEKSGLTKRFLKMPLKLLPQDNVNSEKELARANKVITELEILKKELIVLKKSCWDETLSLKPKRKEEYEYYSQKVAQVAQLLFKMESIESKLEATNLQINGSNGKATMGVSIRENKRVLRRKKENLKIASKKAFKRDVESINIFLTKYTSMCFDEVFEISEVKVDAAKNQYSKSLPTPITALAVAEDAPQDEESINLTESLETVSGGADGDCFVDEEVSNEKSGDEINNNPPYKKTKYKHEKLQKFIKLKTDALRLCEKDFKSLQFSKKDLKSLKLLTSLKFVNSSLEKAITVQVNEWNEASIEVLMSDDAVDSEQENEEVSNDDSGAKILTTENYVEETSEDLDKKLKKKYKKTIKLVLEENGKKMKLKKLRKEVLKRAAEFDDRDDRLDSFKKFIVKVKNLAVIGKYATLE